MEKKPKFIITGFALPAPKLMQTTKPASESHGSPKENRCILCGDAVINAKLCQGCDNELG